jgi:hypothetical protein
VNCPLKNYALKINASKGIKWNDTIEQWLINDSIEMVASINDLKPTCLNKKLSTEALNRLA